jgi:cyclopropane fatty-acyl-phospholipid synthase-like methyltransferase
MIEPGCDRMMIGDLEFDDEFVMDNMMGPNSLRLIEEMTKDLDLKEGMRVLDLGCGKGLTSIYLARKFGVTVYATDLWISATENDNRFRDLGFQDQIIPIQADVHDLPYAEEYFDAIICIDAYHYFGYEEGFLDKHLAPLLKKGGQILIGVPGLQKEFDDGVPEEMKPYYQLDYNFHTCEWWRSLWEASNLVKDIHCREMECPKQAWKEWLSCDNEHAKQDIAMMETENGKYFNTVSFSAVRK